ncbi:hypothetical protein VTJ04DRAFT_9364 [Mycothermus thermophilus]|uniref:uncharacterized protein n=1 Tax=Humicola insolens TaxID=85995 RepID=UPI003744688A
MFGCCAPPPPQQQAAENRAQRHSAPHASFSQREASSTDRCHRGFNASPLPRVWLRVLARSSCPPSHPPASTNHSDYSIAPSKSPPDWRASLASITKKAPSRSRREPTRSYCALHPFLPHQTFCRPQAAPRTPPSTNKSFGWHGCTVHLGSPCVVWIGCKV